MVDFVERLQQRHQIWWQRRATWRDPRTIRRSLHARRDIKQRRFAGDADELWRCCDTWPRKLINKWNGREFASQHGLPVPELYAYATSARAVPIERLPDSYVVRPVLGRHRIGALVMAAGRDLLSEETLTPDAVRATLASQPGPNGPPYVIEERIGRDDGSDRLPLEYKCHTFGEHVAAIERTERFRGGEGGAAHRYYTADWAMFDDDMDNAIPLSPPAPAPAFLDEMLDAAIRVGNAIGTYMRIDFFGGPHGLVFNEFSSTPAVLRPMFTPYCAALFGDAWARAFPDAR
jgi:hypothetical protein